MPAKSSVFTLITIDDKGDPRVEEFDMFAALKIRMLNIQAGGPQCKLLVNGQLVTFEWAEPELIIGGAPTVAKKPRARRRSKLEMDAARKAKANGAAVEGAVKQ